MRARAELGTRGPVDPRESLLGRLGAIPRGTEVRLVYFPQNSPGIAHDKFRIHGMGVDRAANVYQFKIPPDPQASREFFDSIPLGDIEDAWVRADGVRFISVSGCMVPPENNPFHPFRYRSRPRTARS